MVKLHKVKCIKLINTLPLSMMYSLHNHTNYCDGKNSIAEMISTAIDRGIKCFGFSSHAPIPIDNEWSIGSLEKAESYASEIELEKAKNAKIQILKGLEADYIPNISFKFSFLREKLGLDYIIGSVHLVKYGEKIWFIDGLRNNYVKGIENIFDNDAMLAFRTYYDQVNEMIEKENFEILGHCDKILMNNRNQFIRFDSEFHLSLLKETLIHAKEKNIIVEINTRGIYKGLYEDYYPGKYIFKFLKDNKIPIVMSADAHNTEQLTSGFTDLKKQINIYGLRESKFCSIKESQNKKNITFADR